MKYDCLIAGLGEVGEAINKACGLKYPKVGVWDPPKDRGLVYPSKYLHICFPYSDQFESEVESLIKMTECEVCIIHSTVPVGTTRKLGPKAVHSPIHGKHPDLYPALKFFTKYVGGASRDTLDKAHKHLSTLGCEVLEVSSPEASELSKLCCTLQYGWQILLMKEIQQLCKEHQVSFDEVYGWNQHYNDGYTRLGFTNVKRPVLEPMEGPIGGHCVIPNAHLLQCWLSDKLIERNETYKTNQDG